MLGPISSGDGNSGGTVTGTGVAGRVAFWSGVSALSSDANFLWDGFAQRFTANGAWLSAGPAGATPASGSGVRAMWIPSKAAFRAGAVSSTAWDAANIGQYSVGFGFDNQLSGQFGFSQGSGNTISVDNGFALGTNISVSGVGSFGFSTDGASRTLAETNNFKIFNRFSKSKGADIASANDLTLGLDGNSWSITGTTQINRIASANWSSGPDIILLFTNSLTVKHNQAAGGGFASIILAGAADFNATADDILCLWFDGTRWREYSRTVS